MSTFRTFARGGLDNRMPFRATQTVTGTLPLTVLPRVPVSHAVARPDPLRRLPTCFRPGIRHAVQPFRPIGPPSPGFDRPSPAASAGQWRTETEAEVAECSGNGFGAAQTISAGLFIRCNELTQNDLQIGNGDAGPSLVRSFERRM
jgi:hypothetical protein